MIQCPPMKYLTVAPVKSSAASECSWAEQSPSRAIAHASRAIAMRHRSRIGHGPTYSHSMIVDLLGDSLLHVRIAMCARRVRATAASDAWKAQRSPIAVSACAVSAGSGQPEGEHLAARRPEQAKGPTRTRLRPRESGRRLWRATSAELHLECLCHGGGPGALPSSLLQRFRRNQPVGQSPFSFCGAISAERARAPSPLG